MTADAKSIKLGLIGMLIDRSRAPELHRRAGRLCGIAVSYDLIALRSAEPSEFDNALSECRSRGYRGVNVTHPFKEHAARVIAAESERVRRLGAVNTIRFDGQAATRAFNTDYTGFKRAFQGRFPGRLPGTVAIVGAGGVGRAIAFALADLDVAELRLFDRDRTRSERLAVALQSHVDLRVELCESVEEATTGAEGLVNATPVGMHQYPGTPVPKTAMTAGTWAFDAVYTPVDTRFLRDARESGLEVLSGYELFFYQGVDAFEAFTGLRVDDSQLREALGVCRTLS